MKVRVRIMLSAENLRKRYHGKPAVDNISLTVEPGEIVGLLGPNGAGKTTTFYILVGWLPPDEGKVYLNGQEITSLPMYRRARLGLGYLPQEPSVFRKMSVADNLTAVLEFQPISKEEQKIRRDQALKKIGLTALAARIAETLSGGERRKVEIARSLVLNPSFLLLDEPFSGIDPITIEDLRGTIRRLADEGIGILITDHNVRETLTVTNRSYLIFQGKTLLSGSSQELVEHPEARRFYLGQSFTL